LAVHLRLKRMGAKKRPFYRIVAADSRRSRDGRFLEIVGTYNPITKPAEVTVAEDKLTKWLDDGAIPSDTVGSLLTQIGFTEKYLKAKKGEDVSEITLKTTITERKKKTRKMKKATVTVAEEAAEPAEGESEEKSEETPSE
jgi:small subunit ribosomal protein S16